MHSRQKNAPVRVSARKKNSFYILFRVKKTSRYVSYLLVNAFIFVIIAVIGARTFKSEKINSVIFVK